MEWLFSLVKRHATSYVWQVKVMPQSTGMEVQLNFNTENIHVNNKQTRKPYAI